MSLEKDINDISEELAKKIATRLIGRSNDCSTCDQLIEHYLRDAMEKRGDTAKDALKRFVSNADYVVSVLEDILEGVESDVEQASCGESEKKTVRK